MVRELVHDPIFLARKSVAATAEDLAVAGDLLDTLMHHKETCVGIGPYDVCDKSQFGVMVTWLG